MKAPQFRSFRVKDLVPASYNPPGRVSKENIKDLVESMSRIGLIYPIQVSAGGQIIDGHRRATAAKELGWDQIAGIVFDGDPKELYATINVTAKRMGGHDALCVFLKEPLAVSPLVRARLESMRDVLGAKRVAEMAKAGYSHKLYLQSRHVVLYLDRGDDVTLLCQTVDWMMANRVSSVVKQAIANHQPGAVILRAIKANKPLTLKLSVED